MKGDLPPALKEELSDIMYYVDDLGNQFQKFQV